MGQHHRTSHSRLTDKKPAGRGESVAGGKHQPSRGPVAELPIPRRLAAAGATTGQHGPVFVGACPQRFSLASVASLARTPPQGMMLGRQDVPGRHRKRSPLRRIAGAWLGLTSRQTREKGPARDWRRGAVVIGFSMATIPVLHVVSQYGDGVYLADCLDNRDHDQTARFQSTAVH